MALVDPGDGFSLALRRTGLFLQVKSDTDGEESLSRSRNSPGSDVNMKVASSVTKSTWRKGFASV